MVNTELFSLCLVVLIFIWTKNQLIFRRRPFFFIFWFSHTFGPKTHLFCCSEDLFFLVFTYFWYEKGCHHEIPPRVPPFLATHLGYVYQDKFSHITLQLHWKSVNNWKPYQPLIMSHWPFLSLSFQSHFFSLVSEKKNNDFHKKTKHVLRLSSKLVKVYANNYGTLYHLYRAKFAMSIVC